MSGAKHTPGPWNLHPVMEGENDLKCECGGRTYLYSDRYIAVGEKVIARVYMVNGVEVGGFPKVDNHEEFLANVDLIAAAPEMLEDIRELRECLDCYNAVVGLTPIPYNKDCMQERFDAAYALLTKTEKYV